VPHHTRDIKRGLLRAIIQQAGMTVEEFLALL
jgi:predicted RNA binding protein YcfA (HicA-like mRNA interferase family)